jgi:hypothetical protein
MAGASPPPDPGSSSSASGQGVGMEHPANLGNVFSSPKLDETSSFEKFWATSEDQSDDDCEEAEIIMPTKEELISMAACIGFQVKDLILAEDEIATVGTVSFSSPSSAGFKCPLASKIINAIVRDRSLKNQGRPWKESLPKPRISPPKTLGNAMIKNSYMRLRGGQLICDRSRSPCHR